MANRRMTGPFVQMACFCDNVIDSKPGPLSLINVIDTIVTQASGPDVPDVMPPVSYAFYMVVSFKSGKARGRYNLKISPEHPNGGTGGSINQPVVFEGEEKGVNCILKMNYTFPLEGLYWFEIFLNEELMTAIPIRLSFLPRKT